MGGRVSCSSAFISMTTDNDEFIPPHVRAWLSEPHPAGGFFPSCNAVDAVDETRRLFSGGMEARACVYPLNIRLVIAVVTPDEYRACMRVKSFDGSDGGVSEYVLHVSDEVGASIMPVVRRALPLIQEELGRDDAVLVHCMGGISRSASVVIAHLMATRQLSFEAALAALRVARPIVGPNPSFRSELKALEDGATQVSSLHSRLTLLPSQGLYLRAFGDANDFISALVHMQRPDLMSSCIIGREEDCFFFDWPTLSVLIPIVFLDGTTRYHVRQPGRDKRDEHFSTVAEAVALVLQILSQEGPST